MAVSKFIDWERIDEALPAFLTSTLIAFTYSIANGVLAGLIAFALLKTAAPALRTVQRDGHASAAVTGLAVPSAASITRQPCAPPLHLHAIATHTPTSNTYSQRPH